ncbi:MAG: site-specific integrase [Halochromatium sp.]|nr:site-specific integrase [Halochromatium sp.]
MASIDKREGRTKPWRVRIRRHDTSITEYFRTKREATEFAAKVESDFSRWSKMLGAELRRHTLADLLDRYVNQWRGKDHNTPGRLSWWRERFGDRLLSEVDTDMVREGLAQLEAEPAPPRGRTKTVRESPRTGATINRFKAALSSAYKTGVDKGWFGLKQNPVAGIRARKETSRFGRSLDDDERDRLLDACDASTIWPDLGLFVRMALTTGGRRGELLKLEWRDLRDLAQPSGASVLFRDTKNSDDRRVPLADDTRERLLAASKVRLLDDLRIFPGPAKDKPPRVDDAWKAAKALAGVSNLRIHDLRHSCGSYLARAGVSSFQIAAILGHRSGPNLTQRYVHLAAEDGRAAIDATFGNQPEQDDKTA